MIWLPSARQTLRGNVSREIAVRARSARADVRRPSPSLLARLRRWATDGHWEREGKIKRAARNRSRNESLCGSAAAPLMTRACRAVPFTGAASNGISASAVRGDLPEERRGSI